MPGSVTHLKAAYLYAERNEKELYLPEFYLGAIAPDSVNIGHHAPKEIRWAAHRRDKNLDIWEQNALRLYLSHENADIGERSFYLGYLLHLLTDIAWDRVFDKRLCVLLAARGVLPERFKDERWEELYKYEWRQKDGEWYLSVCRELAKAEIHGKTDPENGDLSLWRSKALNKEFAKREEKGLLTDGFMNEFFEYSVRELDSILK